MKTLVLLFLFSVAGISVAIAQINPDTISKKVLRNQPELQNQVQPKKALKNQPEVSTQVQPPKQEIKPLSSNELKIKAVDQIRQLKNGVLLVRLRTSDIAIKNLKKKGTEKKAATVQRQQDAANQRLVYAFEKQFNFCPVFFFYSSETYQAKTGKTSGYFLNNKLQPDPLIAIPDTNFFVAELTELEQFRLDPDSPQESINAEVTFKALVLRDHKFHQLTKPFPFFIKASSNFPPRKRSEAEMVNLMNARLQEFYKQVNQGKIKIKSKTNSK